jgi:nitrosocyanin
MRALARLVLIAVVPVLVVAGCSKSPEERRVAAAVVGGRPGFTPKTVKVDKGDKVELEVGNSTDRPHGFSIDAHNLSRTVDPGKPITVRFTAKRAGTFRIFCQLHPAHQPAQLTVS